MSKNKKFWTYYKKKGTMLAIIYPCSFLIIKILGTFFRKILKLNQLNDNTIIGLAFFIIFILIVMVFLYDIGTKLFGYSYQGDQLELRTRRRIKIKDLQKKLEGEEVEGE